MPGPSEVPSKAEIRVGLSHFPSPPPRYKAPLKGSSAYGFCRTDSKGVIDHYFQGFPSYWNVMVFYFVALSTSPVINLIAVLSGVVLVFSPLRWLYPSRMESMRAPTMALGVLWAVLGLVVLAQMPDHSPALAWLSLFYPAYYTIGSIVYHVRTT